MRFLPILIIASATLLDASSRPVFNIADFGAKPDRSVPATDAFRRAIQAAKSAGGGTIYVPPGSRFPDPSNCPAT